MNDEPFELTPEDRSAIRAALAEIDPRQAAINRRLTAAQRVQKGLLMVEAARRFAIYRLRKSNPELSQAEAQREVLSHYYARKNLPEYRNLSSLEIVEAIVSSLEAARKRSPGQRGESSDPQE